MSILKHSKAQRGGASSHYLTEDNLEVELGPVGVVLETRMSGPNHGTTVVKIMIGRSDYRKVLKAMVRTDRKTALRAMAGVLAKSVG